METKLIVWYGLAGSGKSYNVKETADELVEQGKDMFVVQDFMVGAGKMFTSSPRFCALVAALQSGAIAVIADIQFSYDVLRKEVECELKRRIPDLDIEWNEMACASPEAVSTCIEDARFRAKEHPDRQVSLEQEIEDIQKNHPLFESMKSAKHHSVVPARERALAARCYMLR